MALKDELVFRLRGPHVNPLMMKGGFGDEIARLQALCGESAAEIERLTAALKTTVDALEALRRGHGAEVSGLCYPALNVGRATLEQKEPPT